MKWIWVVVLAVIGVLAAIVAFEYLTVSIHNLPSFIPGRHPGRGHYHKRGAGAAVVAIVFLGAAAYLAVRFVRADKLAAGGSATPSASDGATPSEPTDASGPAQ